MLTTRLNIISNSHGAIFILKSVTIQTLRFNRDLAYLVFAVGQFMYSAKIFPLTTLLLGSELFDCDLVNFVFITGHLM